MGVWQCYFAATWRLTAVETMERKLSLLGPVLALVLFLQCVSSDSVPALVWSNQAPSPNAETRFSTLVDQIEPNELLGEYVKNNVRIVALVQKDLNVEQFAANDAAFVSTIFDNTQSNPVFFVNVKNPRNAFSLFKNDDQSTNDNIVIYLPGKNLKENDETIKSYAEKHNASGPVVFMLTGESNEVLKEHKRVRRQVSDKNDPKPVIFMQHSTANSKIPCLLVTASTATVKWSTMDKNDAKVTNYENPKIKGGAICIDETGGSRIDEVTLVLDKLEVTWTFNTSQSSKWEIFPPKVKIDNTEYPLAKGHPTIFMSKHFSYSCSKEAIKLKATGDYVSGTVNIEGFQIQPFFNGTKDSTEIRFLASEDCAVWFTLPIFSSLIIILILISILYSGVIALMSISTPDRFENPKGRTLIITNFDE